jgi:hypothetical protein
MIKSRKMRLVGYTAWMEERGLHTGCWWESPGDGLENLDIGERITLKFILEKHEVVWAVMTHSTNCYQLS